MDRYFGFINVLATLLLLMVVSVTLVNYTRSQKEFMQIRLNWAANRANDAALLATQMNLQVDLNGDEMLDPKFTYEVYERIFMRCMNITGDSNARRFSGMVPAMVLAADTGYYMRIIDGEAYKYINDGTFDMDPPVPSSLEDWEWENKYYDQPYFTQKIPYSRMINTHDIVADSITGNKIMLYEAIPSTLKTYALNTYTDETMRNYVKSLHKPREIVKELVGAVGYLIESSNNLDGSWQNKFYVPQEFLQDTLYSTVTFKGMTLMTLIQGYDIATTSSLDTFTISGTQLVQAKSYICFEVSDGSRYYIESSKYQPYMGIELRITTSSEEAARNGYNPYPDNSEVDITRG